MEVAVVPTGAGDPLHEVLAPQFLQIVGGAAWGVHRCGGAAAALDLTRQVGRGKAAGRDRQREHRLSDPSHPRFVEVDAADRRVPDLRRERQCSSISPPMKQ